MTLEDLARKAAEELVAHYATGLTYEVGLSNLELVKHNVKQRILFALKSAIANRDAELAALREKLTVVTEALEAVRTHHYSDAIMPCPNCAARLANALATIRATQPIG